MIFYEEQVSIALLVASLPAIGSAYYFLIRDNKGTGIFLLLVSAFLLRLLLISIDPFVHEWDERFHALVAKHMIENPFKPMLFTNHIMSYSISDWGYNHIWVHKQPVFLWQMAISMLIFGGGVIALRIPSALLGCVMVWLVYDCSRKWIRNDFVAYLASILTAFAYYALELTSGHLSLDHNDMAFTCYMTACCWAFTRYLNSSQGIKWALLIGLFAGLAILNKWLVGLLIFGGWALYILIAPSRKELKNYFHFGTSLAVACLIFIPWQLYIRHSFPVESAIAFEYNRKHISEDLGHPGNIFFHLNFLATAYHIVLVSFMLIGTLAVFAYKEINRNISIAFLAMIFVMFCFFSLMVATKMPAFVYPVSALLFIFCAVGVNFIFSKVFDYLQIIPKHRQQLFFFIVISIGILSLKPWIIAEYRNADNAVRNNKIHNAEVYRSLPDSIAQDYVILNTRPYENIELMFYKNTLAYHWYPAENVLDSLQVLGYKFAAFNYENDQQALPAYITNDSSIVVLQAILK